MAFPAQVIHMYLFYDPEGPVCDRDALGNFIRAWNDISMDHHQNYYFHLLECNQLTEIEENTEMIILLAQNYDRGIHLLEGILSKINPQHTPPILTFYCQDGPSDTTALSQKTLGHYWCYYQDVSEVKNQVCMHILRIWNITPEIENGTLMVCSSPLLSLDDFKNLQCNPELGRLSTELKLAAKAYRDALMDPHIEEKELAAREQKYQELNHKKDELSKGFFRASQMLFQDEGMSDLQAQVYKNLRHGDIQSSLQLLSDSEIANRMEASRKQFLLKQEKLLQQEMQKEIQNYLLRIHLLSMKFYDENRHNEIEDTFRTAIAKEKEYHLVSEMTPHYIMYLLERCEYKKAMDLAKQLPTGKDLLETDPEQAMRNSVLQARTGAKCRSKDALHAYEAALQAAVCCAEKDPARYADAYLEISQEAAGAISELQTPQEGLAFLDQILDSLSSEEAGAFQFRCASLHRKAGKIYMNRLMDCQKAGEHFKQALHCLQLAEQCSTGQECFGDNLFHTSNDSAQYRVARMQAELNTLLLLNEEYAPDVYVAKCEQCCKAWQALMNETSADVQAMQLFFLAARNLVNAYYQVNRLKEAKKVWQWSSPLVTTALFPRPSEYISIRFTNAMQLIYFPEERNTLHAYIDDVMKDLMNLRPALLNAQDPTLRPSLHHFAALAYSQKLYDATKKLYELYMEMTLQIPMELSNFLYVEYKDAVQQTEDPVRESQSASYIEALAKSLEKKQMSRLEAMNLGYLYQYAGTLRKERHEKKKALKDLQKAQDILRISMLSELRRQNSEGVEITLAFYEALGELYVDCLPIQKAILAMNQVKSECENVGSMEKPPVDYYRIMARCYSKLSYLYEFAKNDSAARNAVHNRSKYIDLHKKAGGHVGGNVE